MSTVWMSTFWRSVSWVSKKECSTNCKIAKSSADGAYHSTNLFCESKPRTTFQREITYIQMYMYVHMYVYMYVHLYVYMYVHLYIHMYVHMYICTYVCTLNLNQWGSKISLSIIRNYSFMLVDLDFVVEVI
jgi:hypothetical protein